MKDTITTFSKSLIQHGKESDRLYLMRLDPEEDAGFIGDLEDLALKRQYGKIVAKVPATAEGFFLESGFVKEAEVPSYFDNMEDCLFMAKYYDHRRARDRSKAVVDEVLQTALSKEDSKNCSLDPLDPNMELRPCTKDDAKSMARLYKKVFATYPFPIDRASYLKETMVEDTQYYGIFKDDIPIALASVDQDPINRTGELTDFATDPDHQGESMATRLLYRMEEDMKNKGYETLYTIARSTSLGVNTIFAKSDYEFTGTLINNTQISGRVESMNVWHKKVQQSS